MSKEKLNELVTQAYNAIAEAEKIADQLGVSFDFDVAYGMGGTYYPKRKPKMTRTAALELLRNGAALTIAEREEIARVLNDEDDNDGYYGEEGWNSSSSMC